MVSPILTDEDANRTNFPQNPTNGKKTNGIAVISKLCCLNALKNIAASNDIRAKHKEYDKTESIPPFFYAPIHVCAEFWENILFRFVVIDIYINENKKK